MEHDKTNINYNNIQSESSEENDFYEWCEEVIKHNTLLMGHNKTNIKYNNIFFDSLEEVEFYKWCEEALSHNIISFFNYNMVSFTLSDKVTTTYQEQLKTKIKTKTKHLLYAHIYTPDFILEPTEKFNLYNINLIQSNDKKIYIDVKGKFQKHDGSRSFSINQKWMYNKYNIYINKIIPEDFFKLTWVPKGCILSLKKKKIRKKYENIKTIDSFCNTQP